MKRALSDTEVKVDLTFCARRTGYMVASFRKYLENMVLSKERDYDTACDLALRLVQMGFIPPRGLIQRFSTSLANAQNHHEATVLFQFFMQLAALPEEYRAFAFNWAPVSTPATQGDLDAITTALARVSDKHSAQLRLNSLLFLRFVVAMLQRDIDSTPLHEVMLRRLGDATANTGALIEIIFDALQTSINRQEDQRKEHMLKLNNMQEKLEAKLKKLTKDSQCVERKALTLKHEETIARLEMEYHPAYAQSVEATLLIQKLLSLLLRSQPQLKVGRQSAFDWVTLMDKYRDLVWNKLASRTVRVKGKKASHKQRVLLSTADDPLLLVNFTSLFLQRDFGINASHERLEDLRHFLTRQQTQNPELLIELVYYLLRSWLRCRGGSISLEPLDLDIAAFQQHWRPRVENRHYCVTLLDLFQQFQYMLH